MLRTRVREAVEITLEEELAEAVGFAPPSRSPKQPESSTRIPP